ncbi:hypothetical protein JMJ77_0003813 [Colletotrichum scovillei]|uniref:Uncharacterized protein n=1 Tax=Colletotrichum scovillei TaxID=1209932 RepID=A0A9P7U8H7_9PEZI|nr:hypothetical protein JMJ77_0003813 [Colletotrichum scovillei]KAG7063803.1 hypothetical protein JMJ76_0006852 [Colletotrichum scovillei]
MKPFQCLSFRNQILSCNSNARSRNAIYGLQSDAALQASSHPKTRPAFYLLNSRRYGLVAGRLNLDRWAPTAGQPGFKHLAGQECA